MTRDDRIAALLEGVVRRGALAGIATLVWRDGQVVQWAAVGCRTSRPSCRLSATRCFALPR